MDAIMTTCLFFGSIGTLAETSDIQRRAYNQAFAECSVDWRWDAAVYRDLLKFSGGKARLKMLSRATSANFSDALIDDVHALKTKIAGALVREEKPPLRPGVMALIEHGRGAGLRLGLVTTTYRPNIDAILEATGLAPSLFDVVIDTDDVSAGKPAPECYEEALKRLGVAAEDAIAIEDTAVSLSAAVRAGLRTIATPGAYAADQDFFLADTVVDAIARPGGLINPQIAEML